MELTSEEIGINKKSVILDPKHLDFNNCNSTSSNCSYRIVISAKPFSLILLSISEAFSNQNLQLKKAYFKSLLKDKSDCYYVNKTLFNDRELNEVENPDKLIVKAYSHSDEVSLVLLKDPKKLNTSEDDGRIEMNFVDEINFRVNFTQAVDNYLCVENMKPRQMSYRLFVYKESDSENVQKYNFLTNGWFLIFILFSSF